MPPTILLVHGAFAESASLGMLAAWHRPAARRRTSGDRRRQPAGREDGRHAAAGHAKKRSRSRPASGCSGARCPCGSVIGEEDRNILLEPASQEFVEATSTPPFLYELTPAEARKVLDDVQAAPIDKLRVEERWITVPAEVGDVRCGSSGRRTPRGTLPVILYMHGGGWVLGNADTHDRLVRELAVGTEAAVVFVEYDRSPEAHYPVAIEQAYATAQWIVARAPPTSSTPSASPSPATRSAAT